MTPATSHLRQLHIGLSLSPVWLRGTAWRLPDSGVEDMFALSQTLDIARRAEAAHLDFLFRADTLHLDPAVLANAPGFSALDPLVQLASLAAATQHIGLVTTASTIFHAPYTIARQLNSLHWLSNGRAGWNIVTALDGHQNFGLHSMPTADWRYQRAEEFLALVRKLWHSYPNEALVLDKDMGRFADPSMLRPVTHNGEHFDLSGTLTVPTHPSGTPPLFQAGASETGRAFAASCADGVFAATPTLEAAIELRADLRRRAQLARRAPDAIRLMPGLGFILAPTRAEAHDLFAALNPAQDLEKRHSFIETHLGLNLRALPDDAPVPRDKAQVQPGARSRTHAQLLLRIIETERPTVGALLARPEATGSAHWQVVGTPADLVDTICAWHDADALDGVIALPGSFASIDLFLREVVPALAERQRFRRAYTGATLASHLGLV